MYTFDMVLKACVTVEGDSEEEARRIVEGVLDDCAAFTATETAFDGTVLDEVSGECSIAHGLTLVQIDGEDVEDAPEDDPDDEPCPVNRRPKGTCPSGCTHGEV